MPFQANISLTFNGEQLDREKQWTAFIKFDFAILDESDIPMRWAAADGVGYQSALGVLLSRQIVKKYFELGRDSEEGASQKVLQKSIIIIREEKDGPN